MNNELENKLVEILDYIGHLIKDGVDLTKKEVPVIVKEVISYKLLDAIISSIVALAVLVCCAFVAYQVGPISIDSLESILGTIASIVIGFISLVTLSCNVSEIIKIKLAPRVYMIEYIASLKK